METLKLESQRAHDYRHLIARWRGVARAAGLRLEAFAQSGGYPVYCLRTRNGFAGGLYISAGIHGDEPAGCEGLLRWAARHLPRLMRRLPPLPILLLPCLNPWGLIHNRRTDEAGNDLNRIFNRRDISPVGELQDLLVGRCFDLALHLHEDYDAQGNYLYELNAERTSWGHQLLARCRAALPIDGRRRIDKRRFEAGLYLRQGAVRPIPEHPEALHLYRAHCPHVFTFETPSEFDLKRRVQAQVLLIEECTRRLLRLRRSSRF